MKICTKCKQLLSKESFLKDKRKQYISKNKLMSWCKNCWNNYQLEWRNKNPKNKEKMNNCSKKWNSLHTKSTWVSSTLKHHRNKKIYNIIITNEELKNIAELSEYCPICNRKLNWSYGRKLGELSPTLDRVDNELTIRKENVMILCFKCNATKRDRTFIQFIKYCKDISDKFKDVLEKE